MRNLQFLVVALALAGCSSEKKLPQVHASYEPPNGFELVKEQGGEVPRATFSPGIVIARYPTALPSTDPDVLAAALPEIEKLGSGWQTLSARAGTLPVGPVVRIEYQGHGERALHYVVPRVHGFLDLSFTEVESRYGPAAAKVEMSLTHLKAEP